MCLRSYATKAKRDDGAEGGTAAEASGADGGADGGAAADGAASDAFDDLYASNAPKNSIAAGADFGRLAALRELGIATDVSTLERLVLAEVRCHHVVYKVVAYGAETERQRLHGHSIVAPQTAERLGGRDEVRVAGLGRQCRQLESDAWQQHFGRGDGDSHGGAGAGRLWHCDDTGGGTARVVRRLWLCALFCWGRELTAFVAVAAGASRGE